MNLSSLIPSFPTHAPVGILGYAGPEALMPAIVFSFVLVIIVSAMYFGHQRDKLWHETARAAIEKGQPVPLAPSGCRNPRRKGWRDLRAGLIVLAIGLAFFLSHGFPGGHDGFHSRFEFPGYIFTGIGIALIVSALLQGLFSPRKDDVRDPPAGT